MVPIHFTALSILMSIAAVMLGRKWISSMGHSHSQKWSTLSIASAAIFGAVSAALLWMVQPHWRRLTPDTVEGYVQSIEREPRAGNVDLAGDHGLLGPLELVRAESALGNDSQIARRTVLAVLLLLCFCLSLALHSALWFLASKWKLWCTSRRHERNGATQQHRQQRSSGSSSSMTSWWQDSEESTMTGGGNSGGFRLVHLVGSAALVATLLSAIFIGGTTYMSWLSSQSSWCLVQPQMRDELCHLAYEVQQVLDNDNLALNWISYGSLLAQIRYKGEGLIPWEHDMDISVSIDGVDQGRFEHFDRVHRALLDRFGEERVIALRKPKKSIAFRIYPDPRIHPRPMLSEVYVDVYHFRKRGGISLSEMLPFERRPLCAGLSFNSMSEEKAQKYLRKVYGESYMTPKLSPGIKGLQCRLWYDEYGK